jgi:hypothetical protein
VWDSRYAQAMKMKITLKALRDPDARPLKTNNKRADKTAVKPAANLGGAVWRGLKFHLRPREDFREMLHRLATAPFRVKLPGF